jgi:hypothetical protein
MGCFWGQCLELGAWWWGWPVPRRFSWVSCEVNNRGREYCGCRHCLFEQKRAVAKFIVPNCGIKLTPAILCRSQLCPPVAGTMNLAAGQVHVQKVPSITWGGPKDGGRWNHRYWYLDSRGPNGVHKSSRVSPLGSTKYPIYCPPPTSSTS